MTFHNSWTSATRNNKTGTFSNTRETADFCFKVLQAFAFENAWILVRNICRCSTNGKKQCKKNMKIAHYWNIEIVNNESCTKTSVIVKWCAIEFFSHLGRIRKWNLCNASCRHKSVVSNNTVEFSFEHLQYIDILEKLLARRPGSHFSERTSVKFPGWAKRAYSSR